MMASTNQTEKVTKKMEFMTECGIWPKLITTLIMLHFWTLSRYDFNF